MNVGVDPRILRAAEAPLAGSYATDVADELAAFDDASGVLVHVLKERGPISVEVPMEEGEELPEHGEYTPLMRRAAPTWRVHAQTVIGAKALRSMRAARAVLAVGYEWEAQPFVRIIVELLEHREAILADETGRQAYMWPTSRRTAKIAQKSGGLYDNLSRDSHGDAATITRLFDPTDNSIELAPKRTHRTRATLLMLAGFARDQAVVVGLAGMEISGLEHLDSAINAGWDKLRIEFDGGEG